MNRIKLANLLILPFIFSLLNGDEDYGAIGTSRPGATNPTSSVPTGLYQFEMGTNLSTGPGQDTTFTIPAFIRMGVYNHTELQVGYANQYVTIGLLYSGIKLINRLENSIIVTTSLAENNDSLTEYALYFPISYFFKNGLSIWGQAAGNFYNAEEKDPVLSYTLAMGNSLGDKTSWFFEAYQSRPMDQENNNNDPPISVDYGITYLSDNNVQFDISMGITFEKDSDNYTEASRFLEWGFSFRLPE